MDQALQKIAEQGVIGALLVVMLLVIAWLQKKRDEGAEARLKESREALVTAAETNRILSAIKDTLAGLTTSQANLNATVAMMDTFVRGTVDKQSLRDDRVERTIEANGTVIREIEEASRENGRLIEELRKQLDRANVGR